MIADSVLAACKHFDPQCWSDLHKDAYGFRPRGDLSAKSAAELDEIWLATQRALAVEMEASRASEEAGGKRLSEELDKMVEDHGITRADALRWLMQAEGLEAGERGEVEHLCYLYGAPWAMAEELAALC